MFINDTPLFKAIKLSIIDLPTWCKADENEGTETHEWVNAYGDDISSLSNRNKRGDKLLPHYICKYCHAIGKYDDTYGFIFKVR